MNHVDPTIVDAVKTQKEARRTSDRLYVERPTLTLVVHSFNRISNLDQLHQGLRSLGPHELVVCDDGSLDGSHQRWLELLDHPNDFLIHSNDLHEIRATDRAIRLANGELVCLVQDDDQIPTDDGWLDEVLAEFSADPALAIVGGFMGFDSFHPDPARARPIWGPGRFRFVHHVNIGPYFLRRQRIRAAGWLGPLLLGTRRARDLFRQRACLRAWLEGLPASAIASYRSRDPPVTTRWTAAPCSSPPPTANATGSPTPPASTGACAAQGTHRREGQPRQQLHRRARETAGLEFHVPLFGRDPLQRDPRPRRRLHRAWA